MIARILIIPLVWRVTTSPSIVTLRVNPTQQCFGNCLTHSWPMFPFYTPWKHQKTFGSLVLSGGYKMGTFSKNGLNCYLISSSDFHFTIKKNTLRFLFFKMTNLIEPKTVTQVPEVLDQFIIILFKIPMVLDQIRLKPLVYPRRLS